MCLQAWFPGKCPSVNQTAKGPQMVDPPPIADTDQQAAKELFLTTLINFP